jgi:hypothetical protein
MREVVHFVLLRLQFMQALPYDERAYSSELPERPDAASAMNCVSEIREKATSFDVGLERTPSALGPTKAAPKVRHVSINSRDEPNNINEDRESQGKTAGASSNIVIISNKSRWKQ